MSRSLALKDDRVVSFPAYVPVTTFGGKYPLDSLIRPYLPRLAQMAMVSMHYARQMTPADRCSMPLMVDSGGFALLATEAKLVELPGPMGTVLGGLEISEGDGVVLTTPNDVLCFQEKVADVGFTLDFPVPPGTDSAEAQQRVTLTIANAVWAANNRRRRDFALDGCIQGWDAQSYKDCAAALVDLPFSGIAIGGMVPRVRDWDLVKAIVEQTRSMTDKPLHVFGIGKPDLVRELFAMGVDSVDSSSYIQYAAQGKDWRGNSIPEPAVTDQVSLAIENLANACESRLPLSCYRFLRG